MLKFKKHLLPYLLIGGTFAIFLFTAILLSNHQDQKGLETKVDTYLLENPGKSLYAYSGKDCMFAIYVKMDTKQVKDISDPQSRMMWYKNLNKYQQKLVAGRNTFEAPAEMVLADIRGDDSFYKMW